MASIQRWQAANQLIRFLPNLPKTFTAIGISSDAIARCCVIVYLCVALPALLSLVFLTQPFDVVDEATHFYRIVALSHGVIVPKIMRHDPVFGGKPTAGGPVDRGITSMYVAVFSDTAIPNHRSTTFAIRKAMIYRSGDIAYAAHSNTAIYPPFLYVAAIGSTMAARIMDLPVLVWLYLARLANVLVSSWLIARTLRRSGELAPFLLLAATLPITLFQTASASADSLLIGLVIMFAGTLGRLAAGATTMRRDDLLMAIGTVMIASGKVAYMPLAVLPPIAAWFADRRNLSRWRLLAVGSAIGTIFWAGWASVVNGKVFNIRDDVVTNPGDQLRHMIAHPIWTTDIFARSMLHEFRHMVLGQVQHTLGWSSITLPSWFAFAGLSAWALAALFSSTPTPRLRPVLAMGLIGAALCYVAVYFLLYLQFNEVDATNILGVQPRYFLPLLIIVPCLTPRVRADPVVMTTINIALLVWAAFSAILTVVLVYSASWI